VSPRPPREQDPTLEPQRALARHLELTWRRRTHRGFFLRLFGSRLVPGGRCLMDEPGATLLSFDEGRVHPVRFEEVESVRLVRDFLLAPERYLRGIWDG
jgi:hypothetical protein